MSIDTMKAILRTVYTLTYVKNVNTTPMHLDKTPKELISSLTSGHVHLNNANPLY